MSIISAGVRFACFSLACSTLCAHEIPTHINFTKAAVRYLLERSAEWRCALRLDVDLEVGTRAEDDQTRYMFHFLPRLNHPPLVSATCDSLQWGFWHPGEPACRYSVGPASVEMTNDNTWNMAVQNRDTSGTLHLGYVIHLLEDLGSPAHTRNDPHPAKLLVPSSFETVNTGRVPRPGKRTDTFLEFDRPDQYFTTLQTYTQANFYTERTTFDPTLPGPKAVREDNDYFYDRYGRRIAYKGSAYRQSHNRRNATINSVIAREQFDECGSIIVIEVASFLKYYLDHIRPALGGCPIPVGR